MAKGRSVVTNHVAGAGAGGQAGSASLSRASDAKTFPELKQYMDSQWNVTMRSDLQNCDFEYVRAAAQSVEDILTEFPQAAGVLHDIGTQVKGNEYAHATYNGTVNVSPSKFRNGSVLESKYKTDLFQKFPPKGTTAKNIVDHELGHLLERALIRKAVIADPNAMPWTGADMWNKNVQAKAVISEACKAVKKTPGGKGRKNDEIIQHVSRYATKNRSETLAECVADYRANGDNARQLSKEVWAILKRELG